MPVIESDSVSARFSRAPESSFRPYARIAACILPRSLDQAASKRFLPSELNQSAAPALRPPLTCCRWLRRHAVRSVPLLPSSPSTYLRNRPRLARADGRGSIHDELERPFS